MLLADADLAAFTRAVKHHGPVRGREGAGQQQTDVEIPHALLKGLVLAVQDAGRRRGQLAQQKDVAFLDLIDSDAAQPLPPVGGNAERLTGHCPQTGCELARKVSLEFQVEPDKGVFFAVVEPRCSRLDVHERNCTLAGRNLTD